MAPAEALADGDGAMLEADGAADGAVEDPDVLPEPPHAVRLSSAAAATPATVKVVRLIVCIAFSLIVVGRPPTGCLR
jgi:hypothetical protein